MHQARNDESVFDETPPSAGEVRALAHQLLTWAEHLAIPPEPGEELSEAQRHDLILGLAVAARGLRRLRSAIFPDTQLGNSAWDVLLDLFIQEMTGNRTSLDHLALEGDIAAAVVYEAVELLVERGLLERTPDRFDNRIHWLSLTVAGRQGMSDLFQLSTDFVRPARLHGPNQAAA